LQTENTECTTSGSTGQREKASLAGLPYGVVWAGELNLRDRIDETANSTYIFSHDYDFDGAVKKEYSSG